MTSRIKANEIDALTAGAALSINATPTFTKAGTFNDTLSVGANLSVTKNIIASANVTASGTTTLAGTNTLSGATTFTSTTPVSASVGYNMIPEFTGNLYLAGDTATTAQLTNCFSSTYSVYRLVGVVGGRYAGESNVRLNFLTGTNTVDATGTYGATRFHDDSQTAGYGVEAGSNSYATIMLNQSSTGFSVVDYHVYMQQGGVQLLGMSGYHDQSSDRGFQITGFKNPVSTALTGIQISHNGSGNLSAINLSVYGYRIRQNSATKFTGSYS